MNEARTRFMLAVTAAATLLALLGAPDAHACGGFFCSRSAPVDQVGEKILFAVEGTQVEAHIQIQYQGDAEKFSWVLPMPSVPEFAIGSDTVFDVLHAQTDPRFLIEWENENGCDYNGQCWCALEDADFNGSPSAGGGDEVDILAAGQVGPFDYKVIASESPLELFSWLNDNGYDQPAASQPIIQQYVNMDFVFVALRLQKDAAVGEIQPIVLSYEAPSLACIPLKLTSIAAQPNMPIFTWVLADSRAVPLNFFHIVLNPRAYDWLNCAQPADGWGGCGWFGGNTDCQESYLNMVIDASKRANGHGFVTEYAGPSDVMSQQIYQEDRYDLDRLRATESASAFIQQLLNQGFPRTGLMQELIRKHIPKPPEDALPEGCKTDRDFYATWNLDTCLAHMPEDWTFDADAFTDDLDTRLLQPLARAQKLFDDQPYLTRLFTTMDPEHMTKDPLFSFNPDLPDVSNVHTVTARATCKEGSSTEVDHVTLTFADGGRSLLTGEFQQCGTYTPSPASDPERFSSVAEIQMLSEAGAPIVVEADEITELDAYLDRIEAPTDPTLSQIPPNPTPVTGSNTGTFSSTSGSTLYGGDCGCSSVHSRGTPTLPGALALFGLIGAGLIARRRRR